MPATLGPESSNIATPSAQPCNNGMNAMPAQPDPTASASSSSHSPRIHTPPSTDDRDEIDFLGDNNDADLDNDTPVSFKPRQKPTLLSGPSRLFSAFTASPQRNAATAGKDASLAHDWHAEGPGRRVGYEDLTAIDWIFEYTKERQRLRVLSSSAKGLLGYLQHWVDASQVWVILVLTGLLVGAIAAGIDVTSDWLGDLKLGICASGPEGGHFYLNRNFCCYGYDQGSKCAGWRSWSEVLGVKAAGGRWFIEYIFYLGFSVRFLQVVVGADV